MIILGAVLKVLFVLTSASSAVGYAYANAIHKSDGPTKKIANFGVFMAYSVGINLGACLGLSLFCAASGEALLASFLFALFLLPFVLAFFVRSYDRARTAFNLQIVGLILGVAALVFLDPGVRGIFLPTR